MKSIHVTPLRPGELLDVNNPISKVVRQPVANSLEVLQYLELHALNAAQPVVQTIKDLIPDPAGV